MVRGFRTFLTSISLAVLCVPASAGLRGVAPMSVASSTANGNGQFGFESAAFDGGTATFESLGNNQLHQNALGPTSGAITVVPGF